MVVLEAKNLSYAYDDELALDDVSLEVREGQITGLLGSNGAGKSTLFLNLNGILKPDKGQVFLKGIPVGYDKKAMTHLRKNIGIVFQDPDDQLFSASVRKDISFGAMNLGLEETEVKRRVDEAIEKTGIGHLVDKPTHALSFGQKKRIAIAGILVMEPDIMILDEPTAGLDPTGVSELMHLLLKIKEDNGISIIMATHDVDIVPIYCDYVYIMNKGKIVLKGTAEDVFKETEILRTYHLRLPRIGHLMEILSKKDHMDVSPTAMTIGQARASLKKLFGKKHG